MSKLEAECIVKQDLVYINSKLVKNPLHKILDNDIVRMPCADINSDLWLNRYTKLKYKSYQAIDK